MADYPDSDTRRRVEQLESQLASLTALLLYLNLDAGQQERNAFRRYLDNQNKENSDRLVRKDLPPHFRADELLDAIWQARRPTQEQIQELRRGQTAIRDELMHHKMVYSDSRDRLARALSALEKDHIALSTETHKWLSAQSLGN